ncbi:MAG: hypothetical protein GY765_06170 [bacterium]|nr:hypothetical protein [bacterium]
MHHAASLLEGFRSGKLKVSEAFDEGKLAVYFAVTDVLGMRHGAIQKSLKFYYNPITRKLEPIGYDGHFSAFPDNLTAAEIGLNPDMPYYKYHHYWFHKFFNDAENFDEVFFKKYVKALERMTRRSYMATLFKDIDGPLQKNIAQMFTPVDFPPFRDYVVSYGPELFHFDVENLKGRRHAIRGLLTPRKGIPAYYKEFIPGGITLEAANTLKYPVRILGLEVLQGTKTRLLPVAKKTILPATTAHRLVHYRDIPFQFPPDFHWKKDMKTAMTLKFRVLGSRSFKDSLVFHWRRLAEGFSEGDLTRAPGNIAQFDFLEIDERNREIHFKPGTRELSSDLVIPAGYSVFAGEGVRLELRNSAVILSRSPLIFTGTEESPVVIISPDSTGGGLVVMEAGKESLLEHVYFENLRNPSRKGWVLTGAVTFYKSPVKMVHCLFKKNRSEDALNIVSGTYRLEHTRFVSTSADALDCDFSKGHIVDCYFNHCGNDAIDISGGSAEVLRVTVDNACDKGLSAGEGSRMTAEKVTIKNTAIAVTAKDSSRLIMKGGTITDCRIGVTAFQKKPEFGPASIIVNHVKLKTIEVPWLVEKGSPVRHNGKQVAGDKENVKNLLYGKKYGKSSE